ncbi:ABC transporter ATP-binding protein [Amorphoplanes nipponensis]|uniref:ABC transporter ATP-binding protein n=1 Tax=Actinoplanes nipponensis TaxID=135950 RepID=A0A919MLE8_9ACTN|nr:ABC transporter ATP-binding protein [Actinoplanes nipponensis]GIE53869.1 ABC transporter ATP-binding protein [Actinoplanes nipponensis]
MSAVTGDRVLARAVRHGGPWIAVLAVSALAVAGADLLLPAVLGAAVDAALRPGDRPGRWIAAAVALIAVIAAAEILTGLAAGLGTARATARLRHTLIRHVLALAPGAARRHPAGDLVSRLVGQVPGAAGAGPAVALAATALVPPAGSLVALTLIDPWLGATFVAGLVVLTLLLRAYVADTADAATRYQHTQSTIAARLAEALTGARTIGAAATVDAEIRRVLRPLPELGRHGARIWDAIGRAAAQGVLLAPLMQLAVVAVAGLALAAGRLTPGAVLAALQYVALGAGLGGVVGVLGRIARSRAGCRRTAEILAAPAQRYGRRDLPPGAGRLELRGVTVRHPDGAGRPPVLDHLDLVVAAGATVAVVGPSGAGKSALVAACGRLLDPDEGEVLLDGVPLPRVRHESLRRAVGYAFARPVLVGETVDAALALGPGAPTAARIRAAARAARIDTVIERLPDGYDTRLADTPLSGGEAQRLGIARALGAQRLLVLDDATSSLDTVTEHEVGRALIDAADRRTRLVVTHRAGTAARVDRVAWLDHGRLRGYAEHRVLWRDPGYRALFPGAGR